MASISFPGLDEFNKYYYASKNAVPGIGGVMFEPEHNTVIASTNPQYPVQNPPVNPNNLYADVPLTSSGLTNTGAIVPPATTAATTEPAPATPYEPSLEEKLQLQDQWLRAQHMSYLDALRNYSNAYSNTLAALAQRINSPESQVGFSLGGEAPVSWVPRQTLRTAGTLEGLANKAYTTGLAVPTEIWGYQQQHPLYSPDLRYFDIIHNLANASEAMRYGIPTTTQVGDITGPPVSPMTQIGALGQLINTGMDIYRGGKDLGWWGGGNTGGGGGSSNWFDIMTGGGTGTTLL